MRKEHLEDSPCMEPMDNQMYNLQGGINMYFSNTKSFLHNQNDQQVAVTPSRSKGLNPS
jgi:hypothetical protein